MREIKTMETLSYTTFRNHLAGILDKVNDDHEPVLITRQNGKPAVVISLEDFHPIQVHYTSGDKHVFRAKFTSRLMLRFVTKNIAAVPIATHIFIAALPPSVFSVSFFAFLKSCSIN